MSDSTPRRADVRNIAIIAHVDHGKTTLVDALLRQSGEFREGTLGSDLVLDSNDLERERGITILSKNISLPHKAKDGSTVRVNIIDTPGHADFGGEVERVLRMADGALILVDAFEGPRPQTRFVVGKALEVGLRPIVVVNKIDRPNARPEEVLSETFDLFAELGADDETLDFPYLFASGMQGYASEDPECREGTIAPILDAVIEHIPGPAIDPDGPPAVMVTSLTYSEYVGRVATGRIVSGRFKPNQRVVLTRADGSLTPAQITQVELFDKLGRVAVEEATAGDIVALTGLPDPQIGRHRHRPGPARHDAPAGGGRADAVDAVHDQFLPDGREGGEVRHQPEPPRPPDAGVAGQRRVAGSRRPATRTASRSPAAACCTFPSSSRPCGGRATNSPSAPRGSSIKKSTASGTSRSSTW